MKPDLNIRQSQMSDQKEYRKAELAAIQENAAIDAKRARIKFDAYLLAHFTAEQAFQLLLKS